MKRIIQFLSPKSSSGSMLYSMLVHGLIYGTLIAILSAGFGKKEAPQDFLDLGYQTFDAPPDPAQEVKKVVRAPDPVTPSDTKVQPDNAPKELQDEKGEVAGTQVATKTESTKGADTDGQAATTPYYKIKPKYPRAALIAGVEGWVLLQIDINEQGEVENVRVVGGEQRNMFESEAKRAVAQYKYKPFVDGSGKPFRKVDHQVRVNFKLVDEEAGS